VTQTAAITPPTLDTQEIRLATTMTGGVSLAVWIGGVAREIDLLTQASNARRAAANAAPAPAGPVSAEHAERDLYARLLELLDVIVDVDILSGTSAGGINAALLAYTRTRGGDLSPLRDVWLDLGALLDLLRNPTDADIPSLLYGDKWMLKGLNDKIPTLATSKPPKDPISTTLYITTTLLTGESSRFTDAMGTLVQDTDKRGLFTFTEDDLAGNGIEGALALAARSTASFPGAFEPSFLPFDKGTKAAGDVPVRPAVGKYANITRSHWATDGGLLDNQPLDVLLERVFERPAKRPVRRVLLYVVPSPGPAPDLTVAAPGDDLEHPHGLVDALLADLSAATSQSISASLRAIVANNDRVDARADLRLQLARLAGRVTDGRLLTTSLLKAFDSHAAQREALPLIKAMFRLLSTWPPQSAPGQAGIPKEWRPQLEPGGDGERACRTAAEQALTDHWGDATDLPDGSEDYARYGRIAYDNAKSITLAVIRQAYAVADVEGKAFASRLIEPVHRAGSLLDEPDAAALAETACAEAAMTASVPPLAATAEALASLWIAQTSVQASSWDALGAVLARAGATLKAIAAQAEDNTLTTYLGYLLLTDEAAAITKRLFDLAVVEYALLSCDAGAYQKVELVQLSADTRSLLTPNNATAASKLTGLQFHHFGAFYKKSWRANDWMWGRLDAAGWLVHALLDPRRLLLLTEKKQIPTGTRATWVSNQLSAFGPVLLPSDDNPNDPSPTSASVAAELAFLDTPGGPLPQGLPRTSMWLASAFQQLIAREEVPLLAETVVNTSGGPADQSPSESVTWARNVQKPHADFNDLLLKCPIPRETLKTDLGTPLMVKTLAKAAATTTGAVSSVKQVPGPVRPAITAAQTLALGGYRVTKAVGGVPRYLILVGLGFLVLGVAFATQSSDFFGITGLSAAALGAYLVTFGSWQVSSRLVYALTAVTVVVAVGSLAIQSVRRWLFGTESGHLGWVTKQMHWLESTWWHPLLVVGLFVVLVIVVAAIFSGIGGKRKPSKA
jgi:patatin-related protein